MRFMNVIYLLLVFYYFSTIAETELISSKWQYQRILFGPRDRHGHNGRHGHHGRHRHHGRHCSEKRHCLTFNECAQVVSKLYEFYELPSSTKYNFVFRAVVASPECRHGVCCINPQAVNKNGRLTDDGSSLPEPMMLKMETKPTSNTPQTSLPVTTPLPSSPSTSPATPSPSHVTNFVTPSKDTLDNFTSIDSDTSNLTTPSSIPEVMTLGSTSESYETITTGPPTNVSRPPFHSPSPDESTLPPTSTTSTTPSGPNTTADLEQIMNHVNFPLLAGSQCGFGLQRRISFGEEVAPGELPWIVMLRYREMGRMVFRCGGALISSRYVLTAAHCIIHESNKDFKLTSVWLGETDLRSKMECMPNLEDQDEVDNNIVFPVCAPPIEIRVDEAIPHPAFSYKNILKGFPHDIGLIRMKREVEDSLFVRPICLAGLANMATRGFMQVDMDFLSVAGWGMTDMRADPQSKKLMRVNVSLIPQSKCEERLRRPFTCQICAGNAMGNACRGDSGGPLMAQAWGENLDRCPLLLGVVSSGSIQCGNEPPTVFSDALCYLPWILDTVHP